MPYEWFVSKKKNSYIQELVDKRKTNEDSLIIRLKEKIQGMDDLKNLHRRKSNRLKFVSNLFLRQRIQIHISIKCF